MMFPFQASSQGEGQGQGQANQPASNLNRSSNDPMTLALHLQYLQRLQLLQQHAAALCPSVPASLPTPNVAFLPPAAFASQSSVGNANAMVAAAAETLAADAAIAACLNNFHDVQDHQRRIFQNSDHHLSRGPESSTICKDVKPASSARVASKESPPVDCTYPSERESLTLGESTPSPRSATRVLKVLGTTLRSKADTFMDVSRFPVIESTSNEKRRGASVFFPEILYRMLVDVEEEGLTQVISFLPHGRAFRVHNKQLFEQDLLPKYFLGQTKWSSFSRQLNLYGFLRVTTGTDYGAYYHELLIRGRPDLCNFMRRVGKPHGLDRRKFKLAEGEDPDLYNLPQVPELDELDQKQAKTASSTSYSNNTDK